jgi:hypothetical protein
MTLPLNYSDFLWIYLRDENAGRSMGQTKHRVGAVFVGTATWTREGGSQLFNTSSYAPWTRTMSGVNTTIDDVNPNIIYSTLPEWNTGVWSGQTPQPLYGTNHGTPNPGAIATMTFDGTASKLFFACWALCMY